MTKDEARKIARARLEALDAGQRKRAAAAIESHLWHLPAVAAARSLLLYASLPGEVPTAGIAQQARERGILLVYPRCLPEGRLALHQVDEDGLLQAGRYGIREPVAECPLVRAAEIDVVLVPGLAWSADGHRLGRGAGYYDRLLASPDLRALRCGIFFDTQRLDNLPVDPWDVPLDTIITERGTRHFEN